LSRGAYRGALQAFGEVAEVLGEVNDLDGLLHLIAKHICDLADVRRCSVYLRDVETGLFRGQVGHPGRIGDERIKRLTAGVPADRFTQEIVASKQPVVLTNALDDPRPIRSAMRAWNVRSILGVPMVLRGEVIGIVFLDDEAERHTFDRAHIEIASTFADLAAVAISQARVTAELRTSVETVAHQNQLLRRAAAMDERLATLLLEGADIREIAVAVAELTGKPTAIHDAHDRRLAAAVPPSCDEQIVPRLLEAPYRDHPAVVRALRGLSGTRGGTVGPLPDAGLPRRFLIAPVTMREQDCGRLVLMEYGGRFGALDLHIARRAATNVALELAAERREAAAEWDARASLTADLIRGTRDAASLGKRARYLGVDPTVPRVLCLISDETSSGDAVASAEQVCAALSRASGGRSALAAGVAEGVVALLELDDGGARLEAISDAARTVDAALEKLASPGIAAALSTRCTEPADYVRAYTEARQVMTCLRTLAADASMRVLTADDLGPGRLLLASSSRADARRFAQDALGALLVDDEGTRDLLTTLRAFFDAGRSVRRSAVVLGVHENTVRYRLARVEEATGLAISTDAEDQLSAQLALLVLRLEGTLPAAPAAAPEPTGVPERIG
jgi:sugar diacid utilization regulator